MASLVGRTLNKRYHIEELIGRGGMAEVYRAHDTRRGYPIAIKVLREDLAEDWEFLHRFRAEAESLARLAHQNIVRFYSFEQDRRLAFIVMDYVEGDTLRGRIFDAHGPLPPAEALSVLRQLVSALHYAHSEGILHRDVKPGNIMVADHDRVLLSDFGIAKAADAATATTVMPGTPAYMSPEQCSGQLLDQRSDVYALGVVLYEMLTGRRPFVGEQAPDTVTGGTRERIRWEQMHAGPPSPREFNPALTESMARVVLKALAKDPEARYRTAVELLQAFERAYAPRPAVEPRPEPTPVPERLPQPAQTPAAEMAAAAARPSPLPGATRRRRLPLALVLAASVLVVGAVLLLAMTQSGSRGTVSLSAMFEQQTATAVMLAQAQPSAAATATPRPTLSPTFAATRTSVVSPSPTSTPPPSLTLTWTPTRRPTATPTATASATPSPTSTGTARPTSTLSPTRTPTRAPTRTPAPTRQPTAPPRPTTPTGQYAAPTLSSPANGQAFSVGDEIVLAWQPVGSLAADVYYAIAVAYSPASDPGQTWYDEAPWIKETRWTLSEHDYLPGLSADGVFRWSVQVMLKTGTDAKGRPTGTALSPRSAERALTWTAGSGGGGGGGEEGPPSSGPGPAPTPPAQKTPTPPPP